MILTDTHLTSLFQAARTLQNLSKSKSLVLMTHTQEVAIQLLTSGGYWMEVLCFSPLLS